MLYEYNRLRAKFAVANADTQSFTPASTTGAETPLDTDYGAINWTPKKKTNKLTTINTKKLNRWNTQSVPDRHPFERKGILNKLANGDMIEHFNKHPREYGAYLLRRKREGKLKGTLGKCAKKCIALAMEKKASSVITFPKEEHNDIIQRLKKKGTIATTRIATERGKYTPGQKLLTEWGDKLRVNKVVSGKSLKQHPFHKEINNNPVWRKQLKGKPFDVVFLDKEASAKEDRSCDTCGSNRHNIPEDELKAGRGYCRNSGYKPQSNCASYMTEEEAKAVKPPEKEAIDDVLAKMNSKYLNKEASANKNILITGYPGAGKTTLVNQLAKKYNKPVVHLDDLLKTHVTKEQWANKEQMTQEQKKRLMDKLKSYKGSIIEGTMLLHKKFSPDGRQIGKVLKGDRYFIDTPREVAQERKAQRSLDKRPIQKRIPIWSSYYLRRKMREDAPIYEEYDPLVKAYKTKDVKVLDPSNPMQGIKVASGIKQRMIDEAKKGGPVPMDNAAQARIIKHDGKIVGMHTPSRNAKGHPAIGFIYIRDKYRKQGHGSRFASDFKKKHPNMVYYTWDWNKPSVATAEKIGLKRIDTRKMSKGNLFIYGDPKYHKDVKDWGKDDIKYTPINKEK